MLGRTPIVKDIMFSLYVVSVYVVISEAVVSSLTVHILSITQYNQQHHKLHPQT